MDDDELPELVPDPTLPTPTSSKRVPVTVLTGFLGSGKTTLLTYILSAQHGKRIAVIENEFSGGLGIEGMIAKSGLSGESLEGFYELNNGCICCSVKDDLLTTLEQLIMHKDRFDYIIIETTGVANPGPVITSLWTDDGLETSLKLDGVVCVVDSVNVERYLGTADIANDVRMQISYADRILLNKADLVSEAQLARAEGLVKGVNGLADLLRTSFAHTDLSWVLDIDCYAAHRPDASLEFDMRQGLVTGDLCVLCQPTPPAATTAAAAAAGSAPVADPAVAAAAAKHAADSLSTCSLSFPGEVNLATLNAFLDDLLFGNGARIGGGYRHTGLAPPPSAPPLQTVYLRAGADYPQPVVNPNEVVVFSSAAPPPPQPAPAPSSSSSNNSSSSAAGDTDDMRIFRLKGILQVQGESHLQVLQAVFDVFEVRASSYEKGDDGDATKGLNRVVVIGRNLDKAQIEQGFLKCVVVPS